MCSRVLSMRTDKSAHCFTIQHNLLKFRLNLHTQIGYAIIVFKCFRNNILCRKATE